MGKKPHVVAFIFARGGSKGIPGKNIRKLNGRPLIAYAIEVGLQSDLVDEIYVSTDDENIAKIALKHGAQVPFIRPKELARDDSPEWGAWQHAIKQMNLKVDSEIDVLVSIPTTSPLREVEDVDKCIELLIENPETDIVITCQKTNRHPSFNMVQTDDKGYTQLLLKPEEKITRRQDAPNILDMTTVAYAAKAEFVLKSKGIFDGKVRAVIIPGERAVDIDTELDFQFAEFLMEKKNA